MLDKFLVRRMTRSELNTVIAWAETEGWNPGRDDADSFYNTDPQGFFVGVLNQEVIGAISAVAYDQSYGFIGFYLVKPEYRGRGYGYAIWQEAMAYMGDRNVGLDGLIVQQANYEKSGFQVAYRHIRYETEGGGEYPHYPGLVDLSTVSLTELAKYDRLVFPSDRMQFLQNWLIPAGRFALGVISDNQLVGYGVIRPSYQGFRIGPLFANNRQIAEVLLDGLLAKVDNEPVFIDVPDINPEAIALVTSRNMNTVFPAARMYTKGSPNLYLERIFGVTSLELG